MTCQGICTRLVVRIISGSESVSKLLIDISLGPLPINYRCAIRKGAGLTAIIDGGHTTCRMSLSLTSNYRLGILATGKSEFLSFLPGSDNMNLSIGVWGGFSAIEEEQ